MSSDITGELSGRASARSQLERLVRRLQNEGSTGDSRCGTLRAARRGAEVDEVAALTTRTEFIETHDVTVDGVDLDGEITNRTSDGTFQYKTDEFIEYLTAKQLREIADKLDELNVRERLIESA